jgi:hypothetical protein
MIVPPASLAAAIEATDFMRRSGAAFSGESGHKEWLHFAVHAPNVSALVNFSVADDIGDTAKRGAQIGRVTCLVKEDDWDGDVDTYRDRAASARGGRIDVRLGDSFVKFESGEFRVQAVLRRRAVAVDLVLRPEAVPSESNNVFFDDCPSMSWVVLPRLRATGHIHVGSRRHDIVDAPAYHDHNWGSFRWGKNFAWEWGYGLPNRGPDAWSAVFVRFMDRARLADLMRGLLVWHGPRQRRIFRCDEIDVRYEGFARQHRVFKLPRPMGLLAPGTATDVPRRVTAVATSRDDHVEMTFDTDDVAQIVTPNDDDLGVTIINEAFGRVQLTGEIDGEAFDVRGPSTFEFLNG